ncbi:unnamed protein product [Schistosoma mattheei]|uniref:Uncharacterized protein n=1 Tax=Schistosoma mattheei TaxID=31246 RepID=A0A183P035_9TREM|nr:unnamed protein product [Schistosoma mattheei]
MSIIFKGSQCRKNVVLLNYLNYKWNYYLTCLTAQTADAILLFIPPVPTEDASPKFRNSPLTNGERVSYSGFFVTSYSATNRAPGLPGGAVYTPSTSDIKSNRSDFNSHAKRAAKLSLSRT